MKPILLILSLLLSTILLSQDESSNSTIEQFKTHFNNDEYDEIYGLFANGMREQMSFEEIHGILLSLKLGVGKINECEFIITDETNFSHHKTTFENAILDLGISFNNENRITGFTVTQFVEEDFTRIVKNNLKNTKAQLSEQQLSLIFQLCKGFPNNTELSIGFIEDEIKYYYGLKIEGDSMITINNLSLIHI